MTWLYDAMQGLGLGLCLISLAWAWRTRHQRRVWRNSGHNASTVAVILELEEKMSEMERHSASTEP